MTALVNIGREDWENPYYKRKFTDYIKYLSCMTLKMKAPLIIFTEEKVIPHITEARKGKNTFVYPISLQQSYLLWKERENIAKIQEENHKKYPYLPECPELDIPEYVITVNNNKYTTIAMNYLEPDINKYMPHL